MLPACAAVETRSYHKRSGFDLGPPSVAAMRWLGLHAIMMCTYTGDMTDSASTEGTCSDATRAHGMQEDGSALQGLALDRLSPTRGWLSAPRLMRVASSAVRRLGMKVEFGEGLA